jgi:hypothetical protein
MSKLVKIGGVDLTPIECHGERVMTLAMMDEVHKRPDGTARRNFNEHKGRLVDGEDYFVRNSSEARALGFVAPNGLVLLTETGYSMLVKSFNDDLAWDIQRQLVRSYFGRRMEQAPVVLVPARLDDAIQALKLAPLAVRAARALGLDKNAAAISANQFICAVTGQNLLKDFGQTHLLAENQETQWFTPTQLSAEARMSPQKLNAALAAAGFQQRRGKVWELLPAGQPHARLFDTGKKRSSGAMVQQIRWSPAVLARLGNAGEALGQGSLLCGS